MKIFAGMIGESKIFVVENCVDADGEKRLYFNFTGNFFEDIEKVL